MATAKKVGMNLLILWIAAGVVLGAGAMYLVQFAFPGTFVTFRGGVRHVADVHDHYANLDS